MQVEAGVLASGVTECERLGRGMLNEDRYPRNKSRAVLESAARWRWPGMKTQFLTKLRRSLLKGRSVEQASTGRGQALGRQAYRQWWRQELSQMVIR